MNKRQFEEIKTWQEETFGKATAMSKALHLEEEVGELQAAIALRLHDRRLEFADCFLLLFGAAAADGMCYKDIIDCIDEKMKINYQRKWGQSDANGVVHHI